VTPDQRSLDNAMLAAIVESSDDAIISKSLDGIIQSWNAAAERIFGHTAEQAIGRHISLVIPEDRISEEDRIIASLKAAQRIDHFETERVRRDGQRILVSLTISPIRDASGTVVGASKIVRDITAQRRAEAEERRRTDVFLATLAHELRNPLAPMTNMLEVAKRAVGDPVALERAHATIERQLGQLVRLVDDLLDLNRITHDRLELRPIEVELAEIVHQVVDAARPQIDASGHELRLLLPPDPIVLRADPARLAQVFDNLVSNACKYTPPGGVITVRAERAGDEVAIIVADSGLGISPEHLESIFEMFSQIDASAERSQGGLGIGLALARRLVEMHGGSLRARSEGPGRGSEFEVRLPAPVPEPATAKPAQAALEAPLPAARRRILVVDDNLDSATSLALLLEMSGNETFTAHDGASALAAIERDRPDIVLLDLGLPDMSGYDVCREARAQYGRGNLRIVALTGWGQEEDRRRTREAGFDGHLVKPVVYPTLLELLRRLEPAQAPPR
jgi:PAS domain S-box-containing protein